MWSDNDPVPGDGDDGDQTMWVMKRMFNNNNHVGVMYQSDNNNKDDELVNPSVKYKSLHQADCEW